MEELVLAPKKIDGLEGLSVKKLAVGHNHSIALLSMQCPLQEAL